MFPTFSNGVDAVRLTEGKLEAGAPRKVIEWLVFKEQSPFLFESFMRLYPLYGVSAEMLLSLLSDIHHSVPVANREQIVSFLADWFASRYALDFRGRPDLVSAVLDLIGSDPAFAERRAAIVARSSSKGDAPSVPMLSFKSLNNDGSLHGSSSSFPMFAPFDKRKALAFSRWDSAIIAETLTLCSHEMFRSTPPHELCGGNRPMMDKQISLFSNLSNLVVWAISKAAFPLALLKKFIKLAHLFFKMNNFHLLAAIVTGLNSGHVQTMKHVWSELPDSAKQLFEKYETLMSPLRNFSNYRAHLRTINPSTTACYPYLAVLTRDVLHINEGNPTVFPDGALNYLKMSLLGSFIEEWRVFQTKSYDFKWNPKVAAWVGNLEGVPDMSNVLLEEDSSSDRSERSEHERPSLLRKMSTQVKSLLGSRSPESTSPGGGESHSRSESSERQDRRRGSTPSSSLLQVESSHGHSASAPNSRSSSRLSDVTAVSSVSGSASPDEEVVSSKMVRMMLAQKGLQKYEAQFEKHSIRPSQLKELNEYDLIAMGVADRADRTKIARALRDSGNSGKASTDESDPDLDDSDGGECYDDSLAVKCDFGGTVKVIGLNNKTSIPQVESAITKAFKLTPPFVIKLKDLEGDLIRLKNASDLEYALLNHRSEKVLLYIFQ